MPRIEGECDARFEPVRRAFVENFRARGEVGASVCVWHRGRPVVDLWGGLADREQSRPWEPDSMCTIFSATKGLAALAVLVLADRGELDYEAPVARYWPEFATAGKAEITVRTLLNHRAGLFAIDQPLRIADFEGDPERVSGAFERQAPAWAPGERQGYHAISFGPYVGELVRRVSGRSVGRFLAEEVAGPLGADAHLGLPESEEARVARLYPTGLSTFFSKILPRLVTGLTLEGRIYRRFLQRSSPTARAVANPAELGIRGIKNFDSPRVRRLELPWANATASARGLARIYAALIGVDGSVGGGLVRTDAWQPIMKRQSWQEPDAVLLKPMGWSQGFVKDETHLFSPNAEAFGHPGAGGALGWADPVAGLAIGYVPNAMDFRIRSPRTLALCRAAYTCL